MVSKYQLFINGEWVSSESGETFTRVNPADPDEVIGNFQKGNAIDTEKAIDSAESAFDSWSDTPAPKRAEYIFKASQLLSENKDELSQIMTREMGKTLLDASADVQEAINVGFYAAGEGKRLFGYTVPSEKSNKFAMTVRLPIGVAGLISPWNFPIAIPAKKVFYSLICGNTAVLKPASDAPLCATKLVELVEKAGIPKGVLNLVTGPGETVGMALIRDKRVKVISFTGHKDTGAVILREAGLKRLNLEMGGKNPIVVMDDADLKLAVNGVLWGGFETTGQRCTASSRVIVHEKIKEDFEAMLIDQVRRLRLGNGLDPKTDIGPLVNKAAQDKVGRYVEIGKSEGAKLLKGGAVPKDLKGYFFEPTVFTDCTVKMRIAQEEIFGPVISIFSAGDLDEAIEIANSVEYGLSSSIYTKNISNAFIAINKLQAGLTYVNSPTIGAECHLPFGGMKHSGNTREDGPEGIKEFTESKTVYIDYSGKLQKTYIE
ncbi:MAG TPA: aldehyde dehydrogenase family protein [Candidatus Acidoferrales bacterium]|nr:aldehyde dehydrogenase family protein [Candidatus Acidoferrales bacterium]